MNTAITPDCDWWFMLVLRTTEERCLAADMFCRDDEPAFNFIVAHYCLLKEHLYLTIPLVVDSSKPRYFCCSICST